MELAAKQGITIEDWTMTPNLELPNRRRSLHLGFGRFTPLQYCPCTGQFLGRSSCVVQQNQEFGSSSFSEGHWDSGLTFCMEEHHSSYYLMSHDHSPSVYLGLRNNSGHWAGGRPSSRFSTPDRPPCSFHNSYPQMRRHSSPYGEACIPASSFSADFSLQQVV